MFEICHREKDREKIKRKSQRKKEKKVKVGFTFCASFIFFNGKLNGCIECFTWLRPNE